MKPIIRLCAILLLAAGCSFAAGRGWLTDFEAASKQAVEEEKDLLIEFTGSDWCSPCIALRKNVFSKADFVEGTKDRFVLVELDYPSDTSKMEKRTIKQNAELQKRYRINGFPSIILADQKGRPYAMTGGYHRQDVDAYLKMLEELREQKIRRDADLADAESMEGLAKVEALQKALRAMKLERKPLMREFYPEVIEQIEAADPDDSTGFIKEIDASFHFSWFEDQADRFFETDDYQKVVELAKKGLENKQIRPIEKQEMVLYYQVEALRELGRNDEALEALRKAREFDPESKVAGFIDEEIEELSQAKKTQPNDGKAPSK